MLHQIELKVAKEALRKASLLTRNVQNQIKKEDVLEKQDKSPVTVADFGSQALINYVIAKNFPKDYIIAEESADELRKPENQTLLEKISTEINKLTSLTKENILAAIDHGKPKNPKELKRFWTLDPIDGTKGFLRGDHYAIALALIENGKVTAAALACPNLEGGLIFLAAEDQDTCYTSLFQDGEIKSLPKKSEKNFPNAIVCESVESGHTSHGRSEKIRELLKIEALPFRIDSQCKYAAVALGLADIYLRLPSLKGYEEKIWDHAAGFLIVQKAFGTVTDVNGKALDFTSPPTLANNSGVVASGRLDHQTLIKAVQDSE